MPSSPQFLVKTTPELTDAEKAAMSALFTQVFGKPFPAELYESKYRRSCLGRSFHCLMLLDGRVVGAYSAIPVRYRFFGEIRLFALAVDLMIAKEFRGRLSNLKKMSEVLFNRLAEENIAFVFGCARDEIRPIHETVSKWRVVGKVHYYLAPLAIPRFQPVAMLLKCVLRAWNFLAMGRTVPKDWPRIEKLNDADFAAYRYRMFPVDYQRVQLSGGGACVYTTEFYYPLERVPPDIRLGLLLDVDSLTRENFEEAVAVVRSREPRLQVLAYQGCLPFQPRSTLRVPERFERQAWWLMGRILRPDLVDDRIFEISNWNINLSNGDLV